MAPTVASETRVSLVPSVPLQQRYSRRVAISKGKLDFRSRIDFNVGSPDLQEQLRFLAGLDLVIRHNYQSVKVTPQEPQPEKPVPNLQKSPTLCPKIIPSPQRYSRKLAMVERNLDFGDSDVDSRDTQGQQQPRAEFGPVLCRGTHNVNLELAELKSQLKEVTILGQNPPNDPLNRSVNPPHAASKIQLSSLKVVKNQQKIRRLPHRRCKRTTTRKTRSQTMQSKIVRS